MSSSMRSVNIRVTGINKTEKGIIVYNPKKIDKILKEWCVNKKFSYWYIEHNTNDPNDLDKLNHFHIIIKFQHPTSFNDIKKHFPFGKIQNTHSLKSSIQYLIHKNDKTKRQYVKENIVTNNRTELDRYLAQSSTHEARAIEHILEDIAIGKIREYNQWQLIPYDIWIKYRSKIENTHIFYKEKIYMDKDRKILGIFISGATGTGKTTFAKDICRKMGKSFCVSSSSNDPLQDYKGEDVLILDDLRDNTFRFDDLLKLLDLHTKSTSKSRYHNKFFLGEWIIITSSKELEFWYQNVPPEAKQQLKRRLKEHYMLDDDRIKHFQYDPYYHSYQPLEVSENYIKKIKREEEMSHSFLKDLGLETTPLDQLD